MADEFSDPPSYGMADLPAPGPPGDAARSLSPFERAAIRQRRTVLRGRDAPDAHTSPATLASITAGFAPGSGFVDAFGYMPDFKGGYEPSLAQNLRHGDYGAAGGQALGLIGDTLYLLPLAGATVGSALKASRSGRRAARAGSSNLPNPRGRPSEEVFATYEAIPGTRTNHLPGLLSADDAVRADYSKRSSWELAPGDRRDAIYSEMRRPETGQPMRVLPTVETQGFYRNPQGQIETNPGSAARPTLTPDSISAKSISDDDRKLIEAAEAARGYVWAQNGVGYHKLWPGGPPATLDSWSIPQGGKVSVEQLRELQRIGDAHGFDYAIDTGRGVTITNFGPPSKPFDPSNSSLPHEIRSVLPGAEPVRARVDHGLVDFPKWGDGAATRKLLEYVNATPEIRAALNSNSRIPHEALNSLKRDEEFAGKFGVTNEAIQNARRVINKGTGWIDRLEEGLKNGTILPAVAAAILYPALRQQEQEPQESRPQAGQV